MTNSSSLHHTFNTQSSPAVIHFASEYYTVHTYFHTSRISEGVSIFFIISCPPRATETCMHAWTHGA